MDDYDLYPAITATAATCQPVRIQYIHVKGHQDRHKDRPLTIPKMHNVECDKIAKQFVQTSPLQSTTMPNPEFEAAQPHLIIAGKLVCRRVIQALRQAAATPAYWEYLRKRYHWMQADLNDIQWTTYASTMKNLHCNDQRRILLFTHDKLPLRTSKFHPHPGSKLCPSCKRSPEDKWHFLQCQHPARSQQLDKFKLQLIALSLKHMLHPGILTTYWLGVLSI